MKIPFMRLDRQYDTLKDEILTSIDNVLLTGRVLQSQEVQDLEVLVAKMHNQRFGIAVNSGTDALVISLKAAGLKKGDRIAVTNLSFVASASAIVLAGGIPVFVDIDEFYQSDCEKIIELIQSNKIDGILLVHLYGQLSSNEKLKKLADERGIFIIEDAAQALGAKRNGKPAGNIGLATCVSFDPTKVVGAYGSGGMILTDSNIIRERALQFRYHGHIGGRNYKNIGYNSQMASIQAALLLVKLGHYKKWEERRIDIASRYTEALSVCNFIEVPKIASGNNHIFHKYVVRVKEKRNDLIKFLEEKGISTSIHYSKPLHRQECFQQYSIQSLKFPKVDKACAEIMSLPIYPELSDDEINYISECILYFYNHK